MRPADAWHQPEFKDVHQMSVNERVQQNVTGTILSLNDDCLLNILNYLPVVDLLRAEKVCWRFRNIAEMIYKTHKVFDAERYMDEFKTVELRQYLYNIGFYVQTLRIKFHFNKQGLQVLRFAAQYCPNVTELHLSGIEMTYKIKGVQNLFKNLVKLQIESCSVEDKSLVYLMDASKNTTLTELNLAGDLRITGKCFGMFKNIRVANFYSCSNISPRYFVSFIKANPGLEELDIIMCDQMNAACLLEISKLTKLKKLSISNGYAGVYSLDEYSPLKALKSLVHLHISYVSYGVLDGMLLDFSNEVPLQYLDLSSGPMTKGCLKALLNFKTLRGLVLKRKKDCDDDVLRNIATIRTLEEFSISCHDITDSGVEGVVRLNPNLRKLDLTSCHNLTEDLIPALMEITKDRPHALNVSMAGSCLNRSLCGRPMSNLTVQLPSPSCSYPGSSDEASSDDWMDDDDYSEDDDPYDFWNEDSDVDSDYADMLFLEGLAFAAF